MFKPVELHPNFPKMEEEILKFWEDNKIFEKSLEKTHPKPIIPVKAGIQMDPQVKPEDEKQKLFTFYDGPPFATGLPHYGHILASTIKDVIPRYQTMKGKFVRRRWGWDCHGLPIEEIVERMLRISGKKEIEKIGIKKFNETCRSQVLTYVEEWGKTVKRIARWVEFENSYKTMDRDYMESVWWAFKEIYQKNLVYEGRKVLLYCPRCETPVSNFEVAMDNSYEEVTEEAITVKFKLKPGQKIGNWTVTDQTYLLAWTTTPWTLPGNVALAVGKEIEYSLVRKGNSYYILAKSARNLSPTLSELGEGEGEVVRELKGGDLVGLKYEPLYDIPALKNGKSFKVYAADFVNTEEGTGIVHTAVVYGEEDYALGLKEGLPVVPLLDEKGKFNEKAPGFLRGTYFKDSEKLIKKDLEDRGLIFEKRMHQHSYPHCWRCGTTLFYNAIPAWFINIQKIKPDLLKSNAKEMNWYPEHLKHGRYEKSLEQAPDWNISRNRYWGNPIPIWKCGECRKNTVVGSIADLEKKASSGFKKDLDLHRPDIDEVVLRCEHCGGKARRITEIFDSWFEAAAMPFASVHYPFTPTSSPPIRSRRTGGEREGVGFPFPAQFVAEYIAQTRAWFYVMHVQSFILFGHAPFQNVVTTGTILAEDGSKMSKSRNNFPDPWAVIEKYGVDSLRFYLMNSVVMLGDNLNFSERDLATIHRKIVLILWNVYNYFVTYASQNMEPKKTVPTVLDKWVELRTQELVNAVTRHLDNYDTVHATRIIESYINDLSTWYLRRSRGRADLNFFETLRDCLVELSKVIAPFMPYLAEHIFRNLSPTLSLSRRGEGEVESVHLCDWPKVKALTQKQRDLLGQMSEIRKIVEGAHALRAQAGIKLRQPLASLKIPKSSAAADQIPNDFLDILKDEVNVLEVGFGDKLELDTKITPELKIAGLARELERQIQQLRKESDLKIGQMVDLYYETGSAIIEKALKKVDKKKIYASQISKIKEQKSKMDFEKQVEIGGEKVLVHLNKLTS